MRLTELMDEVTLKTTALVVTIAAFVKPVYSFGQYVFKTKDRMDKLDEIHRQVTYEGGLVKRFDDIQELTRRTEHLEDLILVLFNLKEEANFICREDGSNVFVSDAYCKMVGGSRDLLMGFGWRDYISSAEYDEHWKDRFGAGRRVNFKIGNFHVVTQPITLKDGTRGHFGIIKPLI